MKEGKWEAIQKTRKSENRDGWRFLYNIILLCGNQQWRYIMSNYIARNNCLQVSKLPMLEVTDYYKNMTISTIVYPYLWNDDVKTYNSLPIPDCLKPPNGH